MARQIFVRHAHRDTRDRWEDNGLSALGFKQAQVLVDYIEENLGLKTLRHLHCSPKKRCLETLELLAQRTGLEVETVLDLDEQSPTESLPAFLARIQRYFEQFRRLEGLLLCSHGDVLPAFLKFSGAGVQEIQKGNLFVLEKGLVQEINPVKQAF